jgi:hypothetical protein
MANKLILVPEELYKGLLTTSKHTPLPAAANPILHNNNNIEDIGLKLAKRKMDSAKRRIPNRNKNKLARILQLDTSISTRKNIYDQELRRYLRLRKAYHNKPIRVQVIGGGPQIIMKPDESALQDKIDIGLIDDDGLSLEELEENSFGDETARDEEEEEEQQQQQQDKSDDAFKTPKSTASKKELRSQKRTEMKQLLEQAKTDFKEYLLANKSKFGISANGLRIINPKTRKPFANSSIDDLIDRLVNPTIQNMPSPAGVPFLAQQAFKDPFLRSLMLTRFRRYTNLGDTPTNFSDFLGPRYFSNQRGSGFRPTLWRTGRM